MKRRFLSFLTLLLAVSVSQAQLLPASKGVLSAAGKNALHQRIEQAVLSQTQHQLLQGALFTSHVALHITPDNSVRYLPRITPHTEQDLARLPLSKELLWGRVTLEQQREFARLSQVPAHITAQVSPSVVQISLPRDISSFVANGFIVNYKGTNWVALSYHVGGRVGNERIVKMVLNDGSEVAFTGKVEVAGNAGYHEADMSFIRVPDEWQHQVSALQIAPANPDLPVYSFGSVAENSAHDDFIPVKRTILQHKGTSIQMTHAMPGDDPLKPAEISGYCGSPVVQEIDGQIRVVGIFTGHINPVSKEVPAVSFAIDVNKVLPVLMDNPTYTRTLKFLGHPIAQIPLNQRLERMLLWRNRPGNTPAVLSEVSPAQLVEVSELYHFPNEFSYEQAELGFFNQELRSGDKIEFVLKYKQDFSHITYIIP